MRTELKSGSQMPNRDLDMDLVNQQFSLSLLDPNRKIPRGVIGPDGETPPKRFAVYRNNVVVSLMEALGQAYPSIKAILGEDDFQKIARVYVTKHPPNSAMMQTFGTEFPTFLDTFEPLAKSGFFSDLAKLERASLEAYHAADDSILDPSLLGTLPPDKLTEICFEVHSAAFILESRFPVVDLYSRRHNPSMDIDLRISQAALISRPVVEVLVQRLSIGQFIYFKNILDGQTLGTSLEAASELDRDFDPATAIGLMLESGFCSSIRRPELINEEDKN